MENSNFKNIIIALDFDSSALKVAENGFDLASQLNANVILLHVISDSVFYSDSGRSTNTGFRAMGLWKILEDETDIHYKAESFLGRIKTQFGNESDKILVKEGKLEKVIMKVASEFKADFIVMGTHKRNIFKKFVLGNTTQKILYCTNIPILAVPGRM